MRLIRSEGPAWIPEEIELDGPRGFPDLFGQAVDLRNLK